MTNEEKDSLYDVVWSGEDGLIGDRDTRTMDGWTPPKRLYTWSGKYKGKFKYEKKTKAEDPKADIKIDYLGGED